MNFKNIIGGIAIASTIAIVSTPLIYSKQINKIIKKETKNLKSQKIVLKEIKNNDSFFSINRKYIITIKDITPILTKIYPNIKYYQLDRLKKSFDNTKLSLKIDYLKYPIYHKNALTFDIINLGNKQTKYSSKIQQEIIKFIENKGIEILIDTNSFHIVKASLKNIQHTFKENKNTLKILLSNAYILFDNNTITNINQFTLDIKDHYNNTILNMNNLIYTFKQQNDFNYKTNSKISNLTYTNTSKYTNVALEFTDIQSNSKVSSIINSLNIFNGLNIKTTKLNIAKNSVKINNLIFNTNLEKLNLSSIQKISKLLQNKLNNNQILLDNINNLINTGFKFKINPVSIDSATILFSKQKFDISKIKLNINTIMKKNNFDIQTNSLNRLLNYIDADCTIKTTKHNIDLLTKLNPLLNIYLSILAKENKNGIIINISYKNGKLISNGKQLF